MIRFFFIIIFVMAVSIWGMDYLSVAMASITGHQSWLTDSYKKDRFLNALEYSARPVDGSDGIDIVLTFRNDSPYDYPVAGWVNCGRASSDVDDYTGEIEPKNAPIIPAYRTTTYTIHTHHWAEVGRGAEEWLDSYSPSDKDGVTSKWGCRIIF